MTPRPVTVSPLTLLAGAVALAVVLAPTAYAAGLARNSVGTAQLKNSAVTTLKLKKNAVTGAKIKNRSVRRGDLAAGVVPPAEKNLVRRSLVLGDTVALGRFDGLVYTAACVESGFTGVIGTVKAEPASDAAPPNPITATILSTRRDSGASSTEVSGTGASDSFNNLTLLAFAGNAGAGGNALMMGTVQYLERRPAHVEFGMTVFGGTGDQRRCNLRARIAPLG